jgi:hypothetical protein
MVACDPNEEARVRIGYEQLAFYHEYRDGNTTSTPGNDRVWVLFRINSITNQGADAATFEFDRHNLIAVKDQLLKEPAGHSDQALGSRSLSTLTVEPGEHVSNPGCVILTAQSDNITEDFGQFSGTGPAGKVDLLHEIEVDQPVSTSRAPGNDEYSLFIPGDAEVLRNKCGV